MVFWASLLPCEYAMNAEDAICALWKNPLALWGVQLAKSSNTTRMKKNPSAMPMSGDVNSGMMTFSTMFDQMTCCVVPVKTTVAPTRLPISACELEEGMPFHQVKRSHAMAPRRAARMT